MMFHLHLWPIRNAFLMDANGISYPCPQPTAETCHTKSIRMPGRSFSAGEWQKEGRAQGGWILDDFGGCDGQLRLSSTLCSIVLTDHGVSQDH